MASALTESAIKAAIKQALSKAARSELADAQAPGVRFRITAKGIGSWILACRDHAGAMRRFPLGSWPKMSIAEARKGGRDLRGEIRKGVDPIANRRAATKLAREKVQTDQFTMAVLITKWERDHLSKRSPRYALEAVRALRHAFPTHLEKPAANLDRAAIRRVLSGIDNRKASKGNINDRAAIQARTVAYGRACWGWATARELVPSNPFTDIPLPEAAVSRDRVLTEMELTEILLTVDLGQTYGRIVWLLATTGQRANEVAGIKWGELAVDLTTWTIPARRTKNRKPQIVPLSCAARQALSGLIRSVDGDALVFPSSVDTVFSAWAKSKNLTQKGYMRASRLMAS